MSKKQVVLTSFVAAIPAICLLVAIVMNGMDHGGEMFSGLMTVIIVVTGLLVLILGLSPFVLMGLYPAEGFAPLSVPSPDSPPRPGGGVPSGDDDDDFEDDDDDEFDDAGGFDDDDGEFEDEAGGEELFDDGYDDDDFEDESFDDDDWE